jgi:hypothetical protein
MRRTDDDRRRFGSPHEHLTATTKIPALRRARGPAAGFIAEKRSRRGSPMAAEPGEQCVISRVDRPCRTRPICNAKFVVAENKSGVGAPE